MEQRCGEEFNRLTVRLCSEGVCSFLIWLSVSLSLV